MANPIRTLIAFGGAPMDHAIATDFVAISKALISQNLNPTCLSGIDLLDVMDMIGFPLVFGREDLGDRTVVLRRTISTLTTKLVFYKNFLSTHSQH